MGILAAVSASTLVEKQPFLFHVNPPSGFK